MYTSSDNQNILLKSLSVDDESNLFVSGETSSQDFPEVGFTRGRIGGTDVVLLKLDPDANILWSRYYGTIGDDFIYDMDMNNHGQILLTGRDKVKTDGTPPVSHGYVAVFDGNGSLIWFKDHIWDLNPYFHHTRAVFDNDNNIILAGEARVRNTTLMPLDNSYFTPKSSDEYWALHMTKITLFGDIEWATILGLRQTINYAFDLRDEIFGLDVDPLGNISIYGGIWNPEDENVLIDSTLSSDDEPASFSGYIAQIIHPKEDADGDFMQNSYEYQNGLNMYNPDDATQDYDGDSLSNLRESDEGTDPWLMDTDADGIPDGWELDNFLDPLHSDSLQDPDGDLLPNIGEFELGLDPNSGFYKDGIDDLDLDGIPNYWEYKFGFDATDPSDATLDFDVDGLTNLEEFELGTIPIDPDTDGDGESDGDEVHNGADPTNPNDNSASIRRRNIKSVFLIFILVTTPIGYFVWKRYVRSIEFEEAKNLDRSMDELMD